MFHYPDFYERHGIHVMHNLIYNAGNSDCPRQVNSQNRQDPTEFGQISYFLCSLL